MSDLVIGFACSWWHPRAATWSYVAPRLREGMDDFATVVDIETQRWLPLRAVEAGLGKVVGTPWQYSRFERAMVDRRARRGTARSKPDAVIEIADVDTPLSVPNFPYQDMSYVLGMASRATAGRYVNLLPASERRLEALARRSVERMRQATGFFAMSQWIADDVIERGVPAERVKVVHGGLNIAPTALRDPARPAQGRVLFVGLDFERKGGDAVYAACRLLHERGEDVTLTVVGPPEWPLPEPPPSWVDFRRGVPAAELGRLMAGHDVFAMPSRFDAYGIALLDAQAAGLPVIAHNAFAMPELMRPGETGLLVDEVAPEPLADAISRILAEPAFYRRVVEARPALLDRHDWRLIAGRMVDFVTQVVGR
jgi:glycosyltransferase involved in cell wall biosynthesis